MLRPIRKAARSINIWHILVVALIVRLPHLGDCLWHDEVLSTKWNLLDINALFDWTTQDTTPPFHYPFMYVWSRLVDDSEIGLRLPALLFGLGTIWLVHSWISLAFDRRRALLSAFALALSPVHIWYSQEARPYSPLVFFFSLALYLGYTRSNWRERSSWEKAHFGAMVMMVLCHYYAAVLAAAIAVANCFFKGRNNAITKAAIAALMIFGTALLIQLPLQPDLDFGFYLSSFDPLRWINLFFRWFALGMSEQVVGDGGREVPYILRLQPYFVFCFLCGMAAFAGLGSDPGFRPGKRARYESILYLFSLPACLLAATIIGFGSIYYERFLISGLPLFYLIVASGSCVWKTRSFRKAQDMLFVAFVTAVYVSWSARRDNEASVFLSNKADLRQVVKTVGDTSDSNFLAVKPWDYGQVDCRYTGYPLLINWRTFDKYTLRFYNNRGMRRICIVNLKRGSDVDFYTSTYNQFFVLRKRKTKLSLPRWRYQLIASWNVGDLILSKVRRLDPLTVPAPQPIR